MAGLLTEVYQEQFVGGHSWTVPIFLFRYHADVESYLWTFARDADRARQIFGRFGSDFIGLSLGDDGEVVRLKIGRAHVCTPVTNAHLVCRLLLEKKYIIYEIHTSTCALIHSLYTQRPKLAYLIQSSAR